ncbi:MAG: ASCH domain-containing protein [Sedimentibacter sp.]|uniref:ASCH domain-containing protein n=1 Tax=Sedimentibacter sp. TaxID=1960295 RepID=UPI0031580E6A
MNNDSVLSMWSEYTASLATGADMDLTYSAWHFCDNEKDADELAELVLNGTKKATASLYASYEFENEQPPKTGNHSVITDWKGNARCIIKTTDVQIVPFKDVTEEFASVEGEGDKSLKYWRNCHWDYFSREMKEIGKGADEDMLVVCEKFEVVHK